MCNAVSVMVNKQIDIWGLRTPFLFLEWIGMNAMLVFVMAAQGIFAAFVNGWYYETPDKSLVSISILSIESSTCSSSFNQIGVCLNECLSYGLLFFFSVF